MTERFAPGDYDQLHHFVAGGVWDAAPLEDERVRQADRLVGGRDAVLVIDDTALPKKGDHSVGVAPQYATALGKTANCQTLVSLTLARDEVPVTVALRLFLPESWTSDPARMEKAGVRAHWAIENALHWELDVVVAEDAARNRRDHGPQNLAVLRRLALNVARADRTKGSLAGKLRQAGWNDDFLFKLLAQTR